MKTFLIFIASFLIGASLILQPNHETLDVISDLPPINSVKGIKNPPYGSVIQLHVNNDFICTGVVFDEQYIVTAAHCLVGTLGYMRKEEYTVYDPSSKKSATKAKPVGINSRIDYGILKGNFKKFKKAKLNVHENEFSNGSYMACGYPYGQKKISCMAVYPKGNYFFQIAAEGVLYPGMSGGPVYNNITGNIIGVNSAAGDGFVLLAPLIGLYGSFGLEK